MCKALALGIITLLAGCTTTSSPGWYVQSEAEMRQIIGETVFIAIDQYQAYQKRLNERADKGPLKGLKLAPQPTH